MRETGVRGLDVARSLDFPGRVTLPWPDGLTAGDLALLVVAALLVGVAKTALGGLASISVAVFAAVLPARESTGVLLPLLMVGDVFAVTAYREHARWGTLLRLVPTVAVGVVVGAVFVARVDDVTMRRTIGALLLLLVAVNVWLRRARPADAGTHSGLRRRVEAGGYGTLAGFTTMVANAGGPVMSLYLLAMRLPMLAFLGTASWFFALVNAAKVPFSVGLGLITVPSLVLDAALAPAVVAGAFAGRRIIARIDQVLFERLVVVFTVLSALNLLR